MRWGKPTKNKKRIDPRYHLHESSLSRIHQHFMEHDCASLTAFRGDPSDTSDCAGGALPAPKGDDALTVNKTRNRDLKATLLDLGYGVTAIDGSYIEGFNTEAAKEVKEDSFWVVNLQDDPGFFDNIKMLGEKFCQDSVLLVPQGGKDAFLYGTNNSQFPGYGQSVTVGDFKAGEEAEFMSRVKGRPFAFAEELETIKEHSRNSRWAIRKIAQKVLKG